jgi:hypothetical protein
MWGMADDVSWLQGWDEAPRLDGVPMRPTPFDSKFKGQAAARPPSPTPSRRCRRAPPEAFKQAPAFKRALQAESS